LFCKKKPLSISPNGERLIYSLLSFYHQGTKPQRLEKKNLESWCFGGKKYEVSFNWLLPTHKSILKIGLIDLMLEKE